MAGLMLRGEAERRLTALQRQLDAGAVEAASRQAEDDLAAGLEHPLPLNLAAYRRESAGDYAAAEALLQRALKIAPGDMLVLNSLGLLMARQDRHAEALRIFDQIIRSSPGFPQAHHSKAQSLEVVGEDDAAARSYGRAIELGPRYAEPLAGLAQLAARRGNLELAEASAARARAIEPGQPVAGMAQAMVALARDDFASAERVLGALLDGPAMAAADRPGAWALLGDALDGQDRTAEAFAAYARGKAEAGRLHAGRFAAPGRESDLDFVRRLVREAPVPASEPAPMAAVEGGPRQHVFLLGFPRSGTTLLEQVLAGHPDVETIDERDALAAAEQALLRPAGGPAGLASLSAGQIEAHRRLYWDAVAAMGRAPAGKVLVDKLPLNSMKLPLIERLFPEARILFAVRDPRDVVLSCFRRSFRINAAMYEFTALDRTAQFYAAVMSLIALYRDRSPLAFKTVRYEDLVTGFEAEVRALCAFLEIDWRDSLKDFAGAARARAIRTPSAAQVRKGLYRSGAGQWRRYQAELEPVLAVLAPWIERLGYGDPEAAGEG